MSATSETSDPTGRGTRVVSIPPGRITQATEFHQPEQVDGGRHLMARNASCGVGRREFLRRTGLLSLSGYGAFLTPRLPSRAGLNRSHGSVSAARGTGGPDVCELGKLLELVISAGSPGIAVTVKGGNLAWKGARGIADVRHGVPMRPEYRFRSGSGTKPFVATVVLQLIEEGKLALSDTVDRWLPGILPYGDQITVRQLLNHTSGVPDNVRPPSPLLTELFSGIRYTSRTPAELVAIVAGRAPLFPAGTSWSYSNTGYQLAGMIVERVTGTSLGIELQRRIFDPLRLRDTSAPVNEVRITGRHAWARGYSLNLDLASGRPIEGPLLDFTEFNPSRAWASGNIVSSAGDLCTFFRALLRGRLFSPTLLAEMKTTVPTGREDDEHAGLGVFLWESRYGQPVWGKDGDIPGFSNIVVNSEDGRHQACLMVNALFAPSGVATARDLATTEAVRSAFAN